jgi:hypothetical protein
MEKTKTNEDNQAIEADQTSNSQSEQKPSDEVELEEHVHVKTIILLIVSAGRFFRTMSLTFQAIVGIYWVQVIHSTGLVHPRNDLGQSGYLCLLAKVDIGNVLIPLTFTTYLGTSTNGLQRGCSCERNYCYHWRRRKSNVGDTRSESRY